MNIKACARRLITNYGSSITFVSGETTVSSNAYIEPLRYKNKMFLGGSYLPPGYNDQTHYLYIGQADIRLDLNSANVVITHRGENYFVKKAEPFVLKDEIIYIWAVLEKIRRYDCDEISE